MGCLCLALKKMENKIRYTCILVFLVILGISGYNSGVNGAGECGKSSPDREAFKLAPCAMAAQDENAPVSSQCCQAVKTLGHNPACLCAVMLSNTAKSSSVKPEPYPNVATLLIVLWVTSVEVSWKIL